MAATVTVTVTYTCTIVVTVVKNIKSDSEDNFDVIMTVIVMVV